jgi:membrane protein YqaA with SNARE-associated domain
MKPLKNMIRSMYDWTIRLAAHKHAVWALATISFFESIFFPIPPDAVLLPMCLSQRRKSFLYATVCMLASVAGGVTAYMIGLFFYDTVGRVIIAFYGMDQKFDDVKAAYDEWGAWLLVAKGFAPIPYKVMAILSGVLQMNLLTFVIASAAGRSIRFYLIAGLAWKFGDPVRHFIEAHLTKVCLAFLALIILGFVMIKYLV